VNFFTVNIKKNGGYVKGLVYYKILPYYKPHNPKGTKKENSDADLS
jgi:hypothetical protein